MLELATSLIKNREGFHSTPFDSESGFIIGYGRDLSQGITEEEAEILLYADMDSHIDELMSYRFWESSEATPARKAALVALHYSVGARAFNSFTRLTDALDNDDWTRASIELTTSAGRLGLNGGKLLANLLRTGDE